MIEESDSTSGCCRCNIRLLILNYEVVTMLTLLYTQNARRGQDALRELLARYAEKAEKTLVMVPEQQVLEAEKLVCEMNCSRKMEVSSFRRIANSIFRRFGGLRYHYIQKGAKYVVMWRALSSVAPVLKEYKNVSSDDLSMLRLLVATVEELKLYGVLPEQLEKAAEEEIDEKLKNKLSDIALLYAAYHNILHEKHDDASDDVWRAAEIAENKGFFKDTHILLVSFDGFTYEETALLRVMFSEADSLLATLAYDKNDRRNIFLRLKETDRLLRSLASDASLTVKEKTLKEETSKSEIDYFAKNIWQKEVQGDVFCELAPEEGGIRLLKCPGVYEEARFIACDIMRRVMQGARFRDFAIVTRNPDRYLGILDAALEGVGIPYFFSARKDVTSLPLVRMLFAAFDIVNYHFRLEDMVSYMRCGLSGLSLEECDAIEEYASLWKISGKRWYDSYGWQMNPSGFSLTFTEEASERLFTLNQLRETLVSPLVRFFEAFTPKATVKSVSEALVKFLFDLKIPELLSKHAELTSSYFGKNVDREEYALLYDSLLSSLDQLVEVAGDMAVTSREYGRLLSALLMEADIGRLPARFDEVTVGSAELLRKSDTRHVYVMGLCQGEFPSADFESGCFDNDEKEALAAMGLSFSPDAERKIADEKLFFYRSVTSAKQSATLTFSFRDAAGKEKFPSSVFQDTLALFEGRAAEDYDKLPKETLLYGGADIFMYAVQNGYALSCEGLPSYADFALTQALTAEREENLSEDISRSLFGKKIPLSQSKMDRFVLCPFSYHCTYSLQLAPEKSGKFESMDVGSFFHKIFEEFFTRLGGRLKTVEDNEARVILSDVMDNYAASLTKGNPSRRFQALINRLKKTCEFLVMNLLSEFRLSDFAPRFFELPISPYGEEGVISESIPISDTQSVIFKGVIDRVDVFEKDGDVYFRVVDYKIGNKEFSMTDVLMGLNMQMLLYLFALSSDSSGSFAKMLSCKGKPIPAGVLYFSFGSQEKPNNPKEDKRKEDANALLLQSEKRIQRSGVLLNDKEILTAMENTLAGRYLPIKVSKDGDLAGETGTTLATLTELGELAKTIQKTVVSIAKELAGGKAVATKEKKGKHDPCAFCRMKPICRTMQVENEEEGEAVDG